MKSLKEEYSVYRVNSVTERYVINDDVFSFLKTLPLKNKIEVLGRSVLNAPIKLITLGTGTKKILMWSQMHGNESTTTKAVLDFINFLSQPSLAASSILKNCTIKIIPILSPDGATAYTRVNANNIDLNRDAQDRSQPESKVLREVYDAFKPHFCFNLHDQRTIFNVGDTSKPATVSFLAPAFNAARGISSSREKSMQIIVAMNTMLQGLIPNQVGRYDDGFNENCVGDAFQMLDTPTILFESGHFPGDYEREKTREFIFYAIVTAVNVVSNGEIENFKAKDYFNIPENKKQFLDIIISNASVISAAYKNKKAVGILYKEVLVGNKVVFKPMIVEEEELADFYAHKYYDCLKEGDLNELRSNSELWSCFK